MRKITGLIAAGLVAGFSASAMAGTDGWYVGAETGLNIAPKEKLTDSGGAANRTDHISTNDGYGLLGQVGYGFGQVRAEAEIGWRQNGSHNFDTPTASGSAKGSMDALSLMGNVYYDIPTGSAFTPYLGIGAGLADISADKVGAFGLTASNDDGFVPAFQGIAGASYAINDHLALKADYRYFRTGDYSLSEQPGWASPLGNLKGHYVAHSILVGFTYKFGPAAAPAPMAAPAPAPAAPKMVQAAPITKTYMVFFDFNKTAITPDASKIIKEAAANAKTSNSTAIHLTGHTDTVGSEKYNMALSLRRAIAVKDALVKLGIPAGEITVVGKGKTELLVPTKDGVREPQNRRVQIVLD